MPPPLCGAMAAAAGPPNEVEADDSLEDLREEEEVTAGKKKCPGLKM